MLLTLKVSTVSLASITVFSGLDPDRLATGLLYFGVPDMFSFSISFAYRILPVLMEEFQNILLSYRLRGKAPNKKGLWGKVLKLIYQVKIVMLCFYPLMLNTAKRSRTTVEALELKGYRHAMSDKKVRKMKLSQLVFMPLDGIFASVSIAYTLLVCIVCFYIA
jgi:energy-coupling factor transport system permease protein